MSTTASQANTNIYLPVKTMIKGVEALAADVRFFRLELPAGFSYLPG